MTRVMRLTLLRTAGQLLRRDGLPDLAEAVEWAVGELAPMPVAGTSDVLVTGAVDLLRKIAAGTVEPLEVDAFAAAVIQAGTADPRATELARQILAGEGPVIAIGTRLAELVVCAAGERAATGSGA